MTEETGTQCVGIIGYVGERAAQPLLVQGLEHLEYRGYDSAGICLIGDNSLRVTRAVGNLDNPPTRT